MRTARVFIALIVLVCVVLTAKSQAPRVWYFGNGAGILHLSNAPDGIYGSQLYTDEGSSVFTDARGKVILYTNGVRVWNSNHEDITGATDLGGHKSTTQSALILPVPDADNKYFIFSLDEKAVGKGLSYVVVDVKANGGKGEIVKRINSLAGNVTEKLTAVWIGDKRWLIAHKWNSNEFLCFPITSRGVDPPVVSAVGMVHRREAGESENRQAIGYLKPSHDGRQLALTISYKSGWNIEVFNFDPNTGKVSFPRPLRFDGYPYGIEFSPDNTKLYVSFLEGKYGLVQLDLNADNLRLSAKVIKEGGDKYHGALQMAPNNRIYLAKPGRYLDVINKPNNTGKECRLQVDQFKLGYGYSSYGLPNVPVYLPNEDTPKPKEEVVENQNQSSDPGESKKEQLKKSFAEEVRKQAEQKKKQEVDSKQTTSDSKVNETAEQQNYATQNEADSHNTVEQTDIIEDSGPIAKIDLGPDTSLYCVPDYLLSTGLSKGSFEWSTGDKTPSITVASNGRYWVRHKYNGKVQTDTVIVKFAAKASVFRASKAFNPKNKIVNNVFSFTVNDVKDFSLEVLKGKKVLFQTDDPYANWSGRKSNKKLAKPGYYDWKATYTEICTGETIHRQGTVLMEGNH